VPGDKFTPHLLYGVNIRHTASSVEAPQRNCARCGAGSHHSQAIRRWKQLFSAEDGRNL